MDEIAAYLERNRDAIVADILELLAIDSPSEDRAGARLALGAALAQAGRAGFSTRLAAGGDVGIAELHPRQGPGEAPSPAAETLGILAHVDTVPVGSIETWTRSPRGELAGGHIWGRGAVDDKGPLVLALWACRALRDLGRPIRKKVKLFLGTMEEIEWADIAALRASGEGLPDYGFTPDGEFPLVNREKGYCDARITFDRSAAGSIGPWELALLEGGAAANSVPDSARAVLRGEGAAAAARAALAALPAPARARYSLAERGAEAELRASGQAAHSSIPEKGDNALVRLASLLALLGPNPLASFLVEGFAGDVHARALGLQTRPEHALGEYIGLATASPDLARSGGAGFELVVNLRLSYGQTEAELEGVLAAAARRYGFSYSLDSYMPALFIPKDRPYMAALMGAYEARSGRRGEFALAAGTSYAKAMPRIAAFGPVFPGSPDLCHEPDERMSVDDALLCAAIYADAIGAIVGTDRSMA